MSKFGDLQSQIDECKRQNLALTTKLSAKTLPAYKYKTTPGAAYEWWDAAAAGDHVDPRTWTGPVDQYGYPNPSANSATHTNTTTNVANINDNNTVGASMRAGKIRMWVYLPDGAWVRDNNSQTGELGFVDVGGCCGGAMASTAGANTTVNTGTADRVLMDANGPYTEGWYFFANSHSDSGAFSGVDLDISEDGGTTWRNVLLAETSSTMPVVECIDVPFCDDLPTGYQTKEIDDCCQPKFAAGGGATLADVQALIDGSVTPHPDQEICTGNFSDVSGRTGWLHTWSPTYTANSGTITEGWQQVSSARTSPGCETDITVNTSLGNSYMQLRNMWGRAWFDVRLLINGTPVLTWTLQAYQSEDDIGTTNLDDDIAALGSAHLSRNGVAPGSIITVEVLRRHNFVAGNANVAAPLGRVISELRSHFNVHYSPSSIVTGRV